MRCAAAGEVMKIEDGGCHGEADGVVRAGSDACRAAVADGVAVVVVAAVEMVRTWWCSQRDEWWWWLREDECSGCRRERRGAVVFVTALLRTPARLAARVAAAMVMEGEEEN